MRIGPDTVLRFIDQDMLGLKIPQSVYEDRGEFEQDVNLKQVLDTLHDRAERGLPFWELRCAVRWAARRLGAESYLEIGNRTGWSLLQVTRERPSAKIVGFDLWVEDYANMPNSNPQQLRSLLRRSGHAGDLFFVSGDSRITLPAFVCATGALDLTGRIGFDVVTVDGDHSLEGARSDLALCAPLVRPGGALIFDDLVHEQHLYLLDLWHEFARTHPDYFCIENIRDYPGTAIAFRLPLPNFIFGQEPESLSVAGSSTTTDSHPSALTLMTEQLSYLECRVRRLAGLESEIEALRVDRAAKEAVIARLMDEIESINADRAAKDEVLRRIVAELELVSSDRAAKDEAIARLQAQVESRGEALLSLEELKKRTTCLQLDRDAKEAVVARLERELAEVRSDQAAKEEVIGRLKSMLEAKECVIASMGDELSDYRSVAWGLATVMTKLKRRRYKREPLVKPATGFKNSQSTPHITKTGLLHVALDVMQIQFGISGGVEVYMKTLVRALTTEENPLRVTLLCTSDQVPHLRAPFEDRVSYHTFESDPALALAAWTRKNLSERPVAPAAEYANVSFARLREKLGVDILHSPVQIFSRMDFLVPGVLNLHDLQHLRHPENFTAGDLDARNRLYTQSANLASAVIASSDFVRRDIINLMGVPASKVHVVPVAFNPDVERGLDRFTPEHARRQYHLPQTFGFYPAQFWIHKNHARLIEALAIVRSRAPEHDFKLVLTGCHSLSGWPVAERALEKFRMRDHVLTLDFIPTEHLGAIYRLAAFCVMPSLFEASSYPVIEAQMLGCPAMCSNVTSLPELVVGGSGLLFDPLSADDMAEKMLRWLNDPADRLEHARRGQERARSRNSLANYSAHVQEIYRIVRAE